MRPTRSRRLAGLALLVPLAGCTAPQTIPSLEPPPDQVDLVGRWQDQDGADVPDGRHDVLTLAAGVGSTSCSDRDETVFLELAWPAGRRIDRNQATTSGDHQTYVRDRHGSYWTQEQPDLDTRLPAAARATGLHRAGNELYTVPSDPSRIWISRPDSRRALASPETRNGLWLTADLTARPPPTPGPTPSSGSPNHASVDARLRPR